MKPRYAWASGKSWSNVPTEPPLPESPLAQSYPRNTAGVSGCESREVALGFAIGSEDDKRECSETFELAWEIFFAEHDGKSLSDIEALMKAHLAKEGAA